MLVLTRKRDQIIDIGPLVQVRVMEIRTSAVRLGIEAPDDLPVHRREISERLALGGSPARRSDPIDAAAAELMALADDGDEATRETVRAILREHFGGLVDALDRLDVRGLEEQRFTLAARDQ